MHGYNQSVRGVDGQFDCNGRTCGGSGANERIGQRRKLEGLVTGCGRGYPTG